ncbi:excisionase family DNA binding protein [Dysgonomonas sp. PFB1-18]|uniref:helix-turn-helix domain-containing protein n=1 Tax=unclassified Dysgonomonas TaxID=2630389 RepID=UPI0024753A9A|nr:MULTISPECIES: helix-turn-helix domain-containing protein [unclassified Dysgonomonas]MDH6310730.1 excisionase family DNA binding protein [Dysgonomonas sp. PF1-14]MDH6340580.1 excisionase family DNA binding protein [Dysgonomonas sp. PF1-16]MDH6382163.1 excisionase family DNA binding protein [Dysgonomonas sp. PFB1-18]MDH6399507.1 excisionase family DNA binding protein [Dysgonomonas sp. PF1-23]
MKEFILTTPEQLDEIVQNAIKKVLPDKKKDKPPKIPDTYSVEQALSFLLENGYKLSKSKLYKMTADKLLPFRYFGRRIIFSRHELLKWVEQQTVASSNKNETLLAIAESARKKSRK